MAKKKIDPHTISVLEYEAVLQLLSSFCSSTLGRDATRALYPSVDAQWAAARLTETSQMKALLDRGVRVPLAGLRDIKPLIEGFGKKQPVFEPGQLIEISQVLAASGRLRRFFSELESAQYGALTAMGTRLHDFCEIVERIERCIEGDGTVRDDASEKLGELRRGVAQLSERIHRRFAQIVAAPQLRKAIENEKFLMRHGRPVVAIKSHHRNALRGTILDRSNSGATVYIEPDALVELSNELEDVLFEEKKEVGRILWQLSRAVVDRGEEILQSVHSLGLVDLTYGKARFSVAYEMAAPQISSDSILLLREARHPLLLSWASRQRRCDVSEAKQAVVPIDVRLGEDFDLLLVTGPNTGGKTVVLKTIGLLCLMAQSGMHIPAWADSKLPMYRQIHADIGDEQSIEQSLSTFSAHMRQVVRIIERTSEGTLVLLDELGAGTDPAEGAALATAILDKMLAKGGKIVATTHLGQLKSYAYTAPRAENGSVQFDATTLEPTYELLMGTPGSSNALAIASRLGMPRMVVKKARALMADEQDGTTALINQVQTTRQLAERKREQADTILAQAKQKRTEAADELSRVRELGRLLEEQANRQIDESMQAVRKMVTEFVAKMHNAPKSWNDLAKELGEKVNVVAASTPLEARHTEFIESLRRGDSVYVIPFKSEGIVERVRRKRKTVVVLAANKEVEIPFREVCRPPRSV